MTSRDSGQATWWQRFRSWLWMLRKFGVRRTWGWYRMGTERGWMDDTEAADFFRYVVKGGHRG